MVDDVAGNGPGILLATSWYLAGSLRHKVTDCVSMT